MILILDLDKRTLDVDARSRSKRIEILSWIIIKLSGLSYLYLRRDSDESSKINHPTRVSVFFRNFEGCTKNYLRNTVRFVAGENFLKTNFQHVTSISLRHVFFGDVTKLFATFGSLEKCDFRTVHSEKDRPF